jgi:hypothetical protein
MTEVELQTDKVSNVEMGYLYEPNTCEGGSAVGGVSN